MPSPFEELATPAAETPTPPAETPAETEPAPAEIPVAHESVTNQFGIVVSLDEPHFYADAKGTHIFVYGGSPAEKADAVLKYLTENPNQTVYGTDDTNFRRIPWRLVEGKLVPDAPVETRGFLGFFRSFMEAPKPEEFQKLIK
jgi:hypothetical protein